VIMYRGDAIDLPVEMAKSVHALCWSGMDVRKASKEPARGPGRLSLVETQTAIARRAIWS
jgi:hypothetical protein